MKTSPLRFLLFVPVLLAILAGCARTTCQHPVGDTVPRLEAARINGLWLGPKGLFLALRLKDADAGIVEAESFAVNDDGIEKNHGEFLVRETPAGLVANMKQSPDDKPYQFFRIALGEDSLAVYSPNDDLFAELVKQKVLEGTVKDKPDHLSRDPKTGQTGFTYKPGADLTVLGQQEFETLKSRGNNPQTLFLADTDLIFRRVSENPKPKK